MHIHTANGAVTKSPTSQSVNADYESSSLDSVKAFYNLFYLCILFTINAKKQDIFYHMILNERPHITYHIYTEYNLSSIIQK